MNIKQARFVLAIFLFFTAASVYFYATNEPLLKSADVNNIETDMDTNIEEDKYMPVFIIILIFFVAYIIDYFLRKIKGI
ncbi:MAG: hypothetical protein KAI71_06025 [Candidatus Pacebacteria bacterium]|nr:hypothetical protein [Candidatus Paceibacterota bacterium]